MIDGCLLDPEGVHHEFASGMHGRKLDFDKIPDYGSLIDLWIDAVADSIRDTLPRKKLGKLALVSVANGTNRIVPRVAENLGNDTHALLTEKSSAKSVRLTAEAEAIMPRINDGAFVVIEDVATTGLTSASASLALRSAGATDILVMSTWQRRERLEELDAIGVPYVSVINEVLPTLSKEACNSSGPCSQGWLYIEHGK